MIYFFVNRIQSFIQIWFKVPFTPINRFSFQIWAEYRTVAFETVSLHIGLLGCYSCPRFQEAARAKRKVSKDSRCEGWGAVIGSSCHRSIVTLSTGVEVEGSSIFLGRQTEKWADTLLRAPVIHLSHHYWGARKWHTVSRCRRNLMRSHRGESSEPPRDGFGFL